MLRRLASPRSLLVIGGGIVMALVSAKVLFHGSFLNAIPWGVLALASAFLASSRQEAWQFGATFGFVVSYAFLWFDNTSGTIGEHLLILIPLIILPALAGALGGLLAAWLGWALRNLRGGS